jgi:hypothetical protein
MRNAQAWFSSRKMQWLQIRTPGSFFMQASLFLPILRCASYGGSSSRLVDHVILEALVRQWVLSFPWALRLLFGRQPVTLSRCLAVIIRTIETDVIHRAGLISASGARSGVVTLVQRFGSALNLNIHLRVLALDGAYTVGNLGKVKFYRVSASNQTELRILLNRVSQRVVRRLEKEGLLIPDPELPWLDLGFHERLDSLSATSIRGVGLPISHRNGPSFWQSYIYAA